jgi:hypothetical protein
MSFEGRLARLVGQAGLETDSEICWNRQQFAAGSEVGANRH